MNATLASPERVEAAARKLAILAGGGALPRALADAAAAQGRPVHILALSGFCEPSSYAGLPHDIVPIAKVGRIFERLHAAGCRDVVLAGPVRRPGLADLAVDFTGFATLLKLLPVWAGDASLLSRVLGIIEAQGFRAVGAHEILPDLLAGEGVLGRHVPDAAASADIAAGMRAARALGARQRGQAVLVRDGRTLAEEGRAGTGALLGGADAAGAILVKAAMPGQDRRVDLPTIGPATVAQAKAAGLRGIAVEAGEALVLDRAATVAAADAAGLFVTAVRAP
ncbi:MAG: UDP-2,3-diacylglucosamine diphosphatase LpxI [Proteobacteria bacterium]|nr:UDP-2,3-diacylglucosamine diphosphatase LpxI [Pseudomonadota bacterium]